MLVPNRHNASNDYRYGFQGQEKDDEVKGEGNSLNYTFRMHDPRIGRFFAIDPLSKKYPFYSPYAFSGNRVIDAVELEGLEPRIVVTSNVTGYSKTYVYGATKDQITEMVVKTYEAKIVYINSKGEETQIGKSFNVTRDGFIDIGTDSKNNHILANHSSDPANDDPLKIISQKKEEYGVNTPTFTISPIYSPLLDKYNTYIYKLGKIKAIITGDAKRLNNTAVFAKFHVSGFYKTIDPITKKVIFTLGGTFGCYGVVDPSQVRPSDFYDMKQPITASNAEMQRFGEEIQKAQQMQIEEHGAEADVEVKIEKRDYEKVKKVKS